NAMLAPTMPAPMTANSASIAPPSPGAQAACAHVGSPAGGDDRRPAFRQPYPPVHAPCACARSWPGALGTGRGRSARRDLAVELRWPGDDDRPGRPVAGDGETVQPVAGHEHETAGRRRPAVVAAESGELALEHIEHLIFARVHVRVDR